MNKIILSSIIFLSPLMASAQDLFTLSNSQQNLAEQVVSIFENDTPEIQYDYVEKLKDWRHRGLTFGRSGFTSCQDGFQVIQQIQKLNIHHELVQFLPLMKSAAHGEISCSSSVDLLQSQNFISLFKKYRNHPIVKRAQDDIYQVRYLNPTLDLMKKYNLNHLWSFIVLLDTFIQHGEGNDGIEIILEQITLSPPQNAAQELAWIQVFLNKRYVILNTGDAEWQQSTPRVTVLRQLVQKYFNSPTHLIQIRSDEYGNFDLKM
ncbi:MAG: chitosanase [Bdellovibrionaceae bacterium]|nr:chitosanase [Pseudobdellovibrionaceae bacterium]